MGLEVKFITKDSSIDEQIEGVEYGISMAESEGDTKRLNQLKKKLNKLVTKKQSMMDTAGDKGEWESLVPKSDKVPPKPRPRPQKKSKPAMAYGGMANKKKHMYTAGGSVKDYRPMQKMKK